MGLYVTNAPAAIILMVTNVKNVYLAVSHVAHLQLVINASLALWK